MRAPIVMAVILAEVVLATAGAAGSSSTPAKDVLNAWLQAINSGDRAVVRQFVRQHVDDDGAGKTLDRLVEQDLETYATTRGFDLRKIEESAPQRIVALLQTRLIRNWVRLELKVDDADPPQLVGLQYGGSPTPAERIAKQPLSDDELARRIDRLMSRLAKADAFSGTVALERRGRLVYSQGIGLASRAHQAPNIPQTRFNLASITKMFTSIAVMQLVERGQLDLDETVGDVLPDYPHRDVADRVTVRQLLSHTGGLIGAQELYEKNPTPPAALTIAQMLSPFVGEALVAPPGERMEYSNAGYVVLGAIIEKASGQSYHDYVTQHVFHRARMTGAEFCRLDFDPPRVAVGYQGFDEPRRCNVLDLGAIGTPAGGAYATSLDLIRFHRALVSEDLVRVATLTSLWNPVSDNPNREQYALGFEIEHAHGHRFVGHGGGWPGATNRFEMAPELDATIVVLSNYDCDAKAIAARIREWLAAGTRPTDPDPYRAPKLVLQAAAPSGPVKVGSPQSIEVRATNSGGPVRLGIVDLEILDEQGDRVEQQFRSGQTIAADGELCCTFQWTPSKPGRRRLDLGVFGPQWSRTVKFARGAASIEVVE